MIVFLLEKEDRWRTRKRGERSSGRLASEQGKEGRAAAQSRARAFQTGRRRALPSVVGVYSKQPEGRGRCTVEIKVPCPHPPLGSSPGVFRGAERKGFWTVQPSSQSRWEDIKTSPAAGIPEASGRASKTSGCDHNRPAVGSDSAARAAVGWHEQIEL